MSLVKGLIAAPYTPLLPNGDINPQHIKTYYKTLTSQKLSGIFSNGSTADFPSLTIEERMLLTEEWSRWTSVDDQFFHISHVGHTSLRESQKLAEHSGNHGVDAISAIAPFYFKPSSLDALVDFCAEIAEVNPDLPFYYYHIPVLTGVNYSMVDFLKIAKDRIPNLAGIKYTYAEPMDYQLTLASTDLDVLFGVDEIMLSSLPLGAKGWVGSTYNHAPALYLEIQSEFEKGNQKRASELMQIAMKFVKITASYGWAGASKYLLTHVGLDCGPVRAPHQNLSAEQKKGLDKNLEAIGFFEFINQI